MSMEFGIDITFARGYLKDANGPTVEAEGVLIRPAWARDAG